MKGMRKISRGTGFSGVIGYCFEGEDHEVGHGQLIGGSMASVTKIALASEFRVVADQRSDIERPVWHSSLRMPVGEDVSIERWIAIADDYMHEMGWPTDAQYAVFKHTDQHIHIVANRVHLDGSVYLGQNENLKNTRIIGELEKRHGLTITKGPGRDEDGKIIMPADSQVKKQEIEKALRTGARPARVVLQGLVSDAMRGQPSVLQFMERLEVAGVDVLPNVASTGRMNGFSFRYDGLKFSGSELGAAYKWSALQKEIDYEQARDSTALAGRRDAEISRAADDRVAAGVAGATQAARGPAEDGRTDPVSTGSGIGIGGSDSASGAGFARDFAAPGEPGPAIENDRIRAATELKAAADNAGGADGRERLEGITAGARAVDKAAQPAVAKDIAAKVQAWRKQHMALDARTYRLTMKDRVLRDGHDHSHSLGKAADKGDETFYDAAAVEQMIPSLRAKNAQGFDVYITPIEPTYHYILIDDMTPEGLSRFQSHGFKPCLVQVSSVDNFQVVIKCRREGRSDEQQIANGLVVALNKTYGDPKLSGVVRPFRMAGFSNKKPGRNNIFTRVIEAIGGVCGQAAGLLAQLRQRADLGASERAAAASADERIARITNSAKHAALGPLREYQQRAQYLTRGKTVIDWSAVDFGVASEMHKRGFDAIVIAAALREGSPDIATRHSDTEAYITRTMQRAGASVSTGFVPDDGDKPK